MSKLQPTLGVECVLDKLKFPLYASPKLDGIRALVIKGQLVSRTLKPIRNGYVQGYLNWRFFDNMDGELIVGKPSAPDVYRTTNSGIMSAGGEPDFTFFVFDSVDTTRPFEERHSRLKACSVVNTFAKIRFVPQVLIPSMVELEAYENRVLSWGFEGVMLRQPDSPYKFGRSTVNQGYLLKLKRFKDGECTIIGFQEKMHNANELTKDERGYAKRSQHQENKVPLGTLGSLIVKECSTGVEFNIGTGMDDELRKEIWDRQDGLIGAIVKYKHFPIGVKDKPRFPTFLGFRDEEDM